MASAFSILDLAHESDRSQFESCLRQLCATTSVVGDTASTVAAWRTPPIVTPIMAAPVLVSGFPGQLNVSNCTAAGTVFFAYSLAGAGPTSTVYGNAALSAPFVTLSPVTVLGDGTASLMVPVPGSASGVNIWVQALDLSSGDLSNGVSTTVI